MVVSDKGDIQNVYCWLFVQTKARLHDDRGNAPGQIQWHWHFYLCGVLLSGRLITIYSLNT